MAAQMQIPNDRRRIPKVPPMLLMEERSREDYIPQVVSIGPYHHGKPELSLVEEFKPTAVNLFISGGEHNDQAPYLQRVRDQIADIKKYYEEKLIAPYSDDELAEMMLRDACLIIIHMETFAPEVRLVPNPLTLEKFQNMNQHLGMLTLGRLQRDLFLLENQIPLSVIKALIELRYWAGEYENLLGRFLNLTLFGEYRQNRRPVRGNREEPPPEGNGEEPPHLHGGQNRRPPPRMVEQQPCYLLEAFHKLLVFDSAAPAAQNQAANESDGQGPALSRYAHSFRSVTDLKAKGIHFRPSSTRTLKDAAFKSRLIYAIFELPVWCVSMVTRVFFLNMIAYEFSPTNRSMGEVASYINLMKSLIDRPEDVRELREKRILYNMLGSDEEVLNLYRDINTHGADNPLIFREVKDKIQAHCNSEMKTWMAELIHTYFRTPWTFTAFLVAATLLALTAVQVHYAIHPKS